VRWYREIGQFLSLLHEPDAHGLILFGPAGVGTTRLTRGGRHADPAIRLKDR
jgi:hypothetical protein